jgi:FeS assembly SUF system regulator
MMLRLSKLADYGCQVMAFMAHDGAVHSASEVADGLGIAPPTVSKILKLLARNGLVESVLGAKGGYALSRFPRDISVAAIIHAMDGPISITECSSNSKCDRERFCTTRGKLQGINLIIQEALDKVSLEEMISPKEHRVDVRSVRTRGGTS